jgi:hypothetical protein
VKYKIEQYIRQTGGFKTFTAICAGWFLENFLSKEVAPAFGGFPHFPDPEGVLTFKVPMWGGKEDVPWLSVGEDFGDIVQGVYMEPDRWNGQIIQGLSDIRSFDQMVGDFAAG